MSGASNIEKTQVFSGALGHVTLRFWKHILKVAPPLSPPSFSQTSSSGIVPWCQVMWCTLIRIELPLMNSYTAVRCLTPCCHHYFGKVDL